MGGGVSYKRIYSKSEHFRAHVSQDYCLAIVRVFAHQGVTSVGPGKGRVALDRDSGRELALRRGPPASCRSAAVSRCGRRRSNAVAAVQRLFGDGVVRARQQLPDTIQLELLTRRHGGDSPVALSGPAFILRSQVS